ncbi:MAG TPA: hypothetical protein VFQ91_25085 [Bryobacteraceae bacterium]|nr:hypothetical protein [Bryobacteraceae bacterium]
MGRRQKIKSKVLDQIESEFHPLLIVCLQQCAEGRWGQFGQNDRLHDSRWLAWPEASRLKQLAQEVKAAHEETGTQNDVRNRFLALCALRGPNVPGEPRLAATLLLEMGKT